MRTGGRRIPLETPPGCGGCAAFKLFWGAVLAGEKVTFVGFGISHTMCGSIKSMDPTEAIMSLIESGRFKNPVSAFSTAGE